LVADATVPQPVRDESLPLRDEREVARVLPFPARFPWLRVILCVALVALLLAFLFFGTVRVGAGNFNGRRMSVTLIWERFREFLTSQGFSAPVVAALVLSVVIALAGSAYLLWLAFGLYNADASESQDVSAQR
jgi:multisubunit Na+/H+ antiporter MnhC subunit